MQRAVLIWAPPSASAYLEKVSPFILLKSVSATTIEKFIVMGSSRIRHLRASLNFWRKSADYLIKAWTIWQIKSVKLQIIQNGDKIGVVCNDNYSFSKSKVIAPHWHTTFQPLMIEDWTAISFHNFERKYVRITRSQYLDSLQIPLEFSS